MSNALLEPGSPVGRLGLEPEELEFIRLFAAGLTIQQISRRLDVPQRTLRRHVRTMCDRLGLDAPVQVVVMAARAGLL
jgi:DNA-binding NarL/FixJ family response regulator